MEFKLGNNQLEYLKKYQYINLHDWRYLTIKFDNIWIRDWYYIGNIKKLNYDHREFIYKTRNENLMNNKNYYIDNPI